MALAIPGFDPAGFRTDIELAMRMGLPAQPERWPEFVRITRPEPTATVDAYGVPYDLDDVAPEPDEERIQDVLCAVETFGRSEATQHFGPLQPGTAEITFLDTGWRRVEGFEYVNLYLTESGPPTPYRYQRVLMQPTLDTVGVWIVLVKAEDTP